MVMILLNTIYYVFLISIWSSIRSTISWKSDQNNLIFVELLHHFYYLFLPLYVRNNLCGFKNCWFFFVSTSHIETQLIEFTFLLFMWTTLTQDFISWCLFFFAFMLFKRGNSRNLFFRASHHIAIALVCMGRKNK